MLCILYVIVVGALLGIAGLLAERALPDGAPRRWVWCIVIPLSLMLPAWYRGHHAATMGELLGGMASAAPGLDWWARVDALDPRIDLLWQVASRVLLAWGVVSAAWVWRIIRTSRARRDGPSMVDGVPVVVTASVGPATVGMLRSRILLPRWVLALPEAQRRYVVRHEEEHRRAHDGRILFVASLLVIVVPWNLALWWQLRRLALAIEMDCDRRVVRALGDASAYGGMLLTIAEAASRGPRLQPALLGGAGSLESRLTALLAPAPRRRAQRILLPLAVGALLLVVLAMPHPVIARAHVHTPAAAVAVARP